mmetsp:Transcript_39772/g.125578  ORF Transcript_39772/g.125578 Transcript_39772/m.125578 type:complete len:219 (-) Transcript_39772:668-1324(-)
MRSVVRPRLARRQPDGRQPRRHRPVRSRARLRDARRSNTPPCSRPQGLLRRREPHARRGDRRPLRASRLHPRFARRRTAGRRRRLRLAHGLAVPRGESQGRHSEQHPRLVRGPLRRRGPDRRLLREVRAAAPLAARLRPRKRDLLPLGARGDPPLAVDDTRRRNLRRRRFPWRAARPHLLRPRSPRGGRPHRGFPRQRLLPLRHYHPHRVRPIACHGR